MNPALMDFFIYLKLAVGLSMLLIAAHKSDYFKSLCDDMAESVKNHPEDIPSTCQAYASYVSAYSNETK